MIVRDQEENPAKSSVVCGKGSHWGTLPPGTDVQDIPAPTTATLSGPAAGLVGAQNGPFTVALNTAASTSVTVNLASNNGSDTFQATLGGGNVTSITIPAGSTTVTFYLTPGGTAGNRSISITTSPSLTYSGSPIIFAASSITIPAGSTSATFYLTPGGTAGPRNISITTSPALTYSGSPITYSAAAVPTSATLSGPTSGIVGVESTAFTVTVNQPASTGGVTVTPASSIGSDTFQATSGGGNVFNVSEINFGTEGGTTSSPAPTTLFTFQPTDTTKAPWQLNCYDLLFGTTHDSVLSLGYNGIVGSPIVSTEPQLHMNFEQNYWNAGTSSYSAEWYVEYILAGSTYDWRPFAMSLNRANGAADVQCELGPTGDPNYGEFTITSSGSQIFTISNIAKEMNYYGTAFTLTNASAVNGSMNWAFQLNIGADATLGPLIFGMGAIPSATGSSRMGLLYCEDKVAQRTIGLNSYDGIHYGPVSAGAISAASIALTGSITAQVTATSSTDHVQLIVKGNSTQTNNLQSWQNSAGTPVAWVDPYGNFYTPQRGFFGTSTYAGNYTVFGQSAGASQQAFVARAVASQTANIQEWQNSSGTALSSIKSDGSMGLSSLADSAATNNSLYYSTTSSKLCYKDSSGALHTLT